MRISVVIITHNRTEELKACVNSCLDKIDVPFELLIIDNNSNSTAEEVIVTACRKRSDVEIKYYKQDKNLGVSGGRNLGYKLAQEDIIYFIDDDAYIKERGNSFKKIIEYINLDNRICAVATDIYNYRSDCCMSPKLSSINSSKALCFYGASHYIIKSRLNRQVLYPEILFYGHEDLWLSLEIYKMGGYVQWQPTLKVMHGQANSIMTFTDDRVVAIGNKYAVKAVHFSKNCHGVLSRALLRRCFTLWKFNLKKICKCIRYAKKMQKSLRAYSTQFNTDQESEFLKEFGSEYLRGGADSGTDKRKFKRGEQ